MMFAAVGELDARHLPPLRDDAAHALTGVNDDAQLARQSLNTFDQTVNTAGGQPKAVGKLAVRQDGKQAR
jgi:hypothetical protein